MPAQAGGGRHTVFDNYIIEIQPAQAGVIVQAGLVVRDGHHFRFFSASAAFERLDGRLFANPKAAQKAVLHHLTERGRRSLA
jgi:hypothetical protein